MMLYIVKPVIPMTNGANTADKAFLRVRPNSVKTEIELFKKKPCQLGGQGANKPLQLLPRNEGQTSVTFCFFLSDPRVDLPLNDQHSLYIKGMHKYFKNENSSAPGEMSIFESFTP
jgi:hypothetical protein